MVRLVSRFGLTACLALLLPAWSMAQIDVSVSVNVAPPELPVYDQPPIPGDGYVWTPGYWAWSDDDQDYYWVPGTWVEAPQPEYLWTPGYWGMAGALFLWHPGYWGPHVGFYGGVNYGYGYGGNGYEGGYWQGGRLYYNRSVNNINNVNITNVYNKTVINNVTVNRVSYNGGDGVRAAPTAGQLAAERDRHLAPTPQQRQHVDLARHDESLRASQNQGRPPIAATPRPANFRGADVVPARQSGTYSVIGPNRPQSAPRTESSPRDVQPRYQQQPQPQSRPENVQRNEGARPEPRREVQPPVERRAPEAAPRPAQPEPRREAPPQEQRRAQEAPPQRPAPPPHAERPPERAPERPEHDHH